jgi:hypothetical protein
MRLPPALHNTRFGTNACGFSRPLPAWPAQPQNSVKKRAVDFDLSCTECFIIIHDCSKTFTIEIPHSEYRWHFFQVPRSGYAGAPVLAKGRIERIGWPGSDCPDNPLAIHKCIAAIFGEGKALASLAEGRDAMAVVERARAAQHILAGQAS